MQFREIIGQEEAKSKLINGVIDNRISHALLLLGPEGSGKLSLAIAYAQFITCENKQENDSCGLCTSCLKYQKLAHPDLHFVFPVYKKKNDKSIVSDDYINKWREFFLKDQYFNLNQWLTFIGADNSQGNIYNDESYEIIKKLSFKTYEAEYKIMIIWMPEKMNSIASNKLLKLLEEPYDKTLFILVSEDSGQIIQTILSRTQLFKIPKVDDNSIFKYLVENKNIDVKQATNILRISNGNIITANYLCSHSKEQNLFLEYFIQMTRISYSSKTDIMIEWVNLVAKIGREQLKQYLNYSLRMFRENFIVSCNLPNLSHFTIEEQEFSINFSKMLTYDNIELFSNEINLAIYHIERNGNPNIILLDLLLKINKIFKPAGG